MKNTNTQNGRCHSCPYCKSKNISCKYNNSTSLSNNIVEQTRSFIQESSCICCCCKECTSKIFDTSQQTTVTFFIKNNGKTEISVILQISPNEFDFIDDNAVPITIQPGELRFLTPFIFAKFTRVKASTTSPHCIKTTIVMQGQI